MAWNMACTPRARSNVKPYMDIIIIRFMDGLSFGFCMEMAMIQLDWTQITFFEWSPPWNTIYFDIVSDIPFGSIIIWHIYSGILSDILSGILTFFLAFWHSFWHSIWYLFWHTFWHSIRHLFWHLFRHSFWHSFWHLFWHSFWHTSWHLFWHYFWHYLTFLRRLAKVPQRPLSSGARGWGPAVPTEIRSWQLRSGEEEEGKGVEWGSNADKI